MRRSFRKVAGVHKLRQQGRRLAVVLSALVVCLTLAIIVLPALTMSKKEIVMDCPLTVHEHSASCYQIDENGDKVLACGQADYVVHKHDEACYDSDGNLICTLPEIQEHTHDESCYEEQQVLVCDLEENEDHTHTDKCYKTENRLICGKDELHTHNESCFDADGNLVCGKIVLQSHQHDDSCMRKREVSEVEQEKAGPASDEEILNQEKEEDLPSGKMSITGTDGLVSEELKSSQPEVEEPDDSVNDDEKKEQIAGSLEGRVLSASGENYEIKVTYTDEAQISGDAKLKVVEIVPEDNEYDELFEKSVDLSLKEARKQGIKAPLVTETRLFDIEIHGKEGKIEPKAPVQVWIRMFNRRENIDSLSVVHFGEDGPETVDLKNVSSKGNGKRQDIRFEAGAFSVYTLQNVGSLGNFLDGTKYALVSERGTNITSADGKHSVSNFAMTGSMREGTLSGKGVYKDGNTIGGYVTQWGFEEEGGSYRIYMLDGGAKKYVRCDGDNLVLSDSAMDDGLFTVTVDNNKLRFSYNGKYITSTGDNPSLFKLTNSTGNDSLFNLCEVDPDYEEKTARKVSAADWKAPEGNKGRWNENDTVVIYRRIEHDDGSEELYALATDGSLIPVYDGGDSIYYHVPNGKNVNWHISLGASGYYVSSVGGNDTVYLAPSVTNGTCFSNTPMGLLLNGLGSSYESRIENWDQAAYAYAGLHVDKKQNKVSLTPGSDETNDTFLFAVSDTLITEGQLHPVNTVDSASKGITMKIFNYGGDTYHYGYRNSAMQAVMGDDMTTDWNNRKSHVTRTVESKLDEDGFPVSLTSGSYKALFTDGTISYTYGGSQRSINVSGSDANHLFLQTYYDESKTFRYSSMENFAHFNTEGDEAGNFTVYREAGSPNIPTENDHYYYYHGHFMPYNTLDPSVSISRIVDQYGSIADKEEGRAYENVYGLGETPDYYVGMMMEANFTQPAGGTLENGDPVVYRFTGDDDLLVYIDGILVLDVGGIHEPLTGSINFETGVVSQPNFYGEGAGWKNHETSIYEIFKEAHNDGLISDDDWARMKWVDADDDGDYDTFADHTTHSFKMFYMERGAGASNLDLQFNLQVVKKDEFTVRKSLPEGIDTRFANQSYTFKAYFIDDTDNNARKPLYPGAKKLDGTEVCEKVIYAGLKDADGKPLEKDVPFDGSSQTFTLMAGQEALFKMKDASIAYDVEEVGIDENLISKIEINGNRKTITDHKVSAGTDTVEGRSSVNVLNYPYTQNLRITKHITQNSMQDWQADNPVFEFRVYLESLVTETVTNKSVDPPEEETVTNRRLIPYSYGPYYLVKIPAGEENNEEAWEYYKLTGPNNSPIKQNGRVVCSTTGRSGTINSIPPGYTIIVPDLTVGTNFYVEERRINIPDGYVFDHEELEAGTYNENTLGTDDEIISRILTRDSYNEVDGWEFDHKTVGSIKNGVDAHDHVWNRKPTVDIPVEKIWNDHNASDRPGNVMLALIRYKAKDIYLPPEGKGAIIIDHKADYGETNTSTELPDGFVATYTIEDSAGNVVATGTSGPFDLAPGIYKVVSYVNNRGNEPANYIYDNTPIVENVVVREDKSTSAEVTSIYHYKQGGQIIIAHSSSGLPDTTELPEGFSATYTIKDEETNRVIVRNVPIGTYDVPAGIYTVTANVSDNAAPENYVYEDTSSARRIEVASGESKTAELTSSYVYVAPKTYGRISFTHNSSGIIGTSPLLPQGFQVASYRIVGPTTIANAQPGEVYEVEAGEYSVIANVNYAPTVDGYIYAGTPNQEGIVVGTNEDKSLTLISAYRRQGQIHIVHTASGLNGTTSLPGGMSVQYSIINSETGQVVKPNVAAGTYSVPAGRYTVTPHVYDPGTAPDGFFYLGTDPVDDVLVGDDQTVDANLVSRYGKNGTITISHVSQGLQNSPALPDGFNVQYSIVKKSTGQTVDNGNHVAAGTYSIAPGEYTIVIHNYNETWAAPYGFQYNEEDSISTLDVTVVSDENTNAQLRAVYDRIGGDKSTVYLAVNNGYPPHNIEETGTKLEVPLNSTVTLKYQSFYYSNWNQTISPNWKLYYQNGASWTEDSSKGGSVPGETGVDVELGTESVYCILINTDPSFSGSGKLEESLTLKPSDGNLSANSLSQTMSFAPSISDSKVQKSLRSMNPFAVTFPASLPEISLKAKVSGMRGTPVVSDVDSADIIIPEEVSNPINAVNNDLQTNKKGYRYVLDESFGKQLVLSDPWTYTFAGLEEVSQHGHPYYYALVEVGVPDGYTLSYTNNPVSAEDILKNMEDIAKADQDGTTSPALLTMSAINAKDIQTGDMIVEKKVSGRTDTTNSFTFEIAFSHSSEIVDGTYTVVKTKADNVVDETVTSLTVTGGKTTITLRANEKIQIRDLPIGTNYTVTESDSLPAGYTQGTHVNASGTISEDTAVVTATMNNLFSQSIKIVKIDETTRMKTTWTKLPEAKFKLFKYIIPEEDGEGAYTAYPDGDSSEKTTNAQGELTFDSLTDGKYRIDETTQPDGYVTEQKVEIYFTVEGGQVKRTDQDGIPLEDQEEEVNLVTYSSADTTFVVGNNPGAALPNTGGPGTKTIHLFGILVSVFACAGLLIKWRRRMEL